MQRQSTIFWIIAGVFVVFISMGAAIANAQEHRLTDIPTTQEYFTDVILVNQDGVEKRLYSDLLKDKTVVVSVFYCACAGDCPTIMKRLVDIQGLLGNRLGEEVTFLTISVDPRMDTPDKLKQYANSLNAGKGWEFLTGDSKAIETTLYKFGQGVKGISHDSTILLIGNEAKGNWKMKSGLSTPEVIFATVSDMLDGNTHNFTMNMDD